MMCLNILFKSIPMDLNPKFLMVIFVKEFQCNFLRTGCFIAGSFAGWVIPFETPFLLMWGEKNIKRLMWLVKLQSTYLEAEKLCCISTIGSKYCQEKRIIGHIDEPPCFQPGILERHLCFHEIGAIFFNWHQRGAVAFETHHTMLLWL